MKNSQTKAWKLVLGFILTSIASTGTILVAAQKIVFTRPEAEALSNRVEKVETNYREDMKEIRQRLDTIIEKVDRK